MSNIEEIVTGLTSESISLSPYNPSWPRMFEDEKAHLRKCLPAELIGRIEHFGSTAVPGLAAKPIIDMLVEVFSMQEAKERIVPILQGQGYDYIWRPSFGDDIPPWYCWFIKRDDGGIRTHHIHLVEPDFEHWDRLKFRDYLVQHPDVADEYAELKYHLSKEFPHERVKYTEGKTEFIRKIMQRV